LPASDPRICRTIEAIERELTVDGLAARYDTTKAIDGLLPGEDPLLGLLSEHYDPGQVECSETSHIRSTRASGCRSTIRFNRPRLNVIMVGTNKAGFTLCRGSQSS
jgi:hypothetical protein